MHYHPSHLVWYFTWNGISLWRLLVEGCHHKLNDPVGVAPQHIWDVYCTRLLLFEMESQHLCELQGLYHHAPIIVSSFHEDNKKIQIMLPQNTAFIVAEFCACPLLVYNPNASHWVWRCFFLGPQWWQSQRVHLLGSVVMLLLDCSFWMSWLKKVWFVLLMKLMNTMKEELVGLT